MQSPISSNIRFIQPLNSKIYKLGANTNINSKKMNFKICFSTISVIGTRVEPSSSSISVEPPLSFSVQRKSMIFVSR